MENQIEKVYKDMILGVAERYQYVPPGINRIFGEVEYLLCKMSETEKEEKCNTLIDKPWDYLVQYKIDKVIFPFSEISPLSICLAFKMLIWSQFHPDRLLSFLSQGGGESCKLLSFVPLPLGKTVIGSWLDAGLSYEKHQELFDCLLLKNQTCRGLIFPKARYPSTQVNMSSTSIRTLLQKARMGRSYEKNIPVLVTEIQERLNEWKAGIFPFYSRRRSGEDHAELLAVLIIRNREAYFYIRNQDAYYEINRIIPEEE